LFASVHQGKGHSRDGTSVFRSLPFSLSPSLCLSSPLSFSFHFSLSLSLVSASPPHQSVVLFSCSHDLYLRTLQAKGRHQALRLIYCSKYTSCHRQPHTHTKKT